MGTRFAATVVFGTRNRVGDLCSAIESTLVQSVPLEIIVLDDASTDGTADVVERRFPQVKLVRSDQPVGVCALRNKGARMAAAPFVVLLDDDVVLTSPLIIEQTLDLFGHPRVGLVTIPFANVRLSPDLVQRAPDNEGVYVAGEFVGCSLVLRRDIFLYLGGYRELFQYRSEEPDYAIRMLAAGYVVRLGTSDPAHHFLSPRRDLAFQNFYTARNCLLLLWCNIPMPALVPRMAWNVLFHLRGGISFGQAVPTLKGFGRAFWEMATRRCPRRPVSRSCYRLARKVKPGWWGSIKLEDIEPELPPMARMAGDSNTAGDGLARADVQASNK